MQPLNFEQELKKRADEFTLQPSENVWQGVASQASLAGNVGSAFSWVKFSLNLLLPAVIMVGSGLALNQINGDTTAKTLSHNLTSDNSMGFASTSVAVDVVGNSFDDQNENVSLTENVDKADLINGANVIHEKPVLMTSHNAKAISKLNDSEAKPSNDSELFSKNSNHNATKSEVKLSEEEIRNLELETKMLSRIKGKRTDFKFNTSAFSKGLDQQKKTNRNKW